MAAEPSDLLILRRSQMTSAGLRLRPGIAFDEWLGIGRGIGGLSRACAWALGDWVNYGEHAYGRRYRVAVGATGFDYQTLRNYAWVARSFELSRRRDTLSFQHHAEVAALPEPQQDLWLSRAETERWSRNELRRQLATHGRPRPTAIAMAAPVVQLSIPPEREQLWRQAAARAHQDLNAWVLACADAAARALLEPRSIGELSAGRSARPAGPALGLSPPSGAARTVLAPAAAPAMVLADCSDHRDRS